MLKEAKKKERKKESKWWGVSVITDQVQRPVSYCKESMLPNVEFATWFNQYKADRHDFLPFDR